MTSGSNTEKKCNFLEVFALEWTWFHTTHSTRSTGAFWQHYNLCLTGDIAAAAWENDFTFIVKLSCVTRDCAVALWDCTASSTTKTSKQPLKPQPARWAQTAWILTWNDRVYLRVVLTHSLVVSATQDSCDYSQRWCVQVHHGEARLQLFRTSLQKFSF